MSADEEVARSERFELPTLGFEVRCSIQLSYERSFERIGYQSCQSSSTALKAGTFGEPSFRRIEPSPGRSSGRGIFPANPDA
jgi:hypothetical protein